MTQEGETDESKQKENEYFASLKNLKGGTRFYDSLIRPKKSLSALIQTYSEKFGSDSVTEPPIAKPVVIVILGKPKTGKSMLGQQLEQIFNIPCYDISSLIDKLCEEKANQV